MPKARTQDRGNRSPPGLSCLGTAASRGDKTRVSGAFFMTPRGATGEAPRLIRSLLAPWRRPILIAGKAMLLGDRTLTRQPFQSPAQRSLCSRGHTIDKE